MANVNQVTPRKFNLSQRVQVTTNKNRGRSTTKCLGTIIGYEDGRDLGRYSPKFNGWVYHVVLDVNDERVMVEEKDCQRC